MQVLHTALVLAYLSELKADIVVELAELENVYVLKDVLSTLMSYSTKELPPTLKSSPLVSSDPTMLLHAGERLVCLDQYKYSLLRKELYELYDPGLGCSVYIHTILLLIDT